MAAPAGRGPRAGAAAPTAAAPFNDGERGTLGADVVARRSHDLHARRLAARSGSTSSATPATVAPRRRASSRAGSAASTRAACALDPPSRPPCSGCCAHLPELRRDDARPRRLSPRQLPGRARRRRARGSRACSTGRWSTSAIRWRTSPGARRRSGAAGTDYAGALLPPDEMRRRLRRRLGPRGRSARACGSTTCSRIVKMIAIMQTGHPRLQRRAHERSPHGDLRPPAALPPTCARHDAATSSAEVHAMRTTVERLLDGVVQTLAEAVLPDVATPLRARPALRGASTCCGTCATASSRAPTSPTPRATRPRRRSRGRSRALGRIRGARASASTAPPRRRPPRRRRRRERRRCARALVEALTAIAALPEAAAASRPRRARRAPRRARRCATSPC